MKGSIAIFVHIIHAIQCQRRKFPQITKPTVVLAPSSGGINLCPDAHAYAFRNGDSCCKSSQDCQGNEINWSSSCCSNNDYVDCQTGGSCENASPPCLGLTYSTNGKIYQALKKGFSPNGLCNGANERKKRSAQRQSIRPNRRGRPQTGDQKDKFGDWVILNYRPIFVNCESNQCVWFDDNRYWRKGDCDLVGTQNSDADCFSEQDASCPATNSCSSNNCKSNSVGGASSTLLARRFKRERALVEGTPSCNKIDDVVPPVAVGGSATTGSSAASNTYQVRDGRYYSSCTWKKPQGYWICV